MSGWRFQAVLGCLAECSPRARSRPISCVSVRSCAFSSRSRMCVELLKTARVIIHPCPAPFHPVISSNSIAPFLSPSCDTGGGACSFACRLVVLPFCGRCVVGSSLSPIGLRCLVVSSVSVLSPAVPVVLSRSSPRALWVSCLPRAASSCRSQWGLSSHRLSPRSPDTAGGERSVPVACGACGRCHRVRMMRYHPGPFSSGVLLAFFLLRPFSFHAV